MWWWCVCLLITRVFFFFFWRGFCEIFHHWHWQFEWMRSMWFRLPLHVRSVRSWFTFVFLLLFFFSKIAVFWLKVKERRRKNALTNSISIFICILSIELGYVMTFMSIHRFKSIDFTNLLFRLKLFHWLDYKFLLSNYIWLIKRKISYLLLVSVENQAINWMYWELWFCLKFDRIVVLTVDFTLRFDAWYRFQ